MATTATPSTWKASSHSHSHSHSSSSRPSRPPATPRVPTNANVAKSTLSPNARSPQTTRDVKSPSPNYFSFVVPGDSPMSESNQSSVTRSNGPDPSKMRHVSNEKNPEFELFRRQSEKNIAFALNSLPQSRLSISETPPRKPSLDSPVSPTTSRKPEEDAVRTRDNTVPHFTANESPFFATAQRHDSPMNMSPRHSINDQKVARLSLPAHEISGALENLRSQRCDTLPPQPTKENHVMAAPQETAQILEKYFNDCLVLDLRVYPQYAASRIRGALNLCISTLLLKRPTFTVSKLADTFSSNQDKAKFEKWRACKYIIVYDTSSSLPKEAGTSFNVLKKFVTEGWKGKGLVVKGGFSSFSKIAPRLVDQSAASGSKQDAGKVSSPSPPPNQQALPVIGGCPMPATKNAANPFFGNIRQNMDLLDGVGQFPIKRPKDMRSSEADGLPRWLKRAASVSNEGKEVSDKFLGIEKTEQKRMQTALSGTVSYGTPNKDKTPEIQVAGIEKGSKNRYNNIFPFEHSRVRLQNVPSYGCDYVNASFIKTKYSNRRYIATQAPVPSTFDDFWRVIWEQDARVIVMLTAEKEGGQVKSDAYWKTGKYGDVKVEQLVEKTVSLSADTQESSQTTQRKSSSGRRLTTSSATPAVEKRFNFEPTAIKTKESKATEEACVVVRQFSLSHATQASRGERKITQIQWTEWPDLGIPASPTSLLALIEVVNKYQRGSTSPSVANGPSEPANAGQKPIMVHCSAGCGRTGTFCTIDSVIDMMKRQRQQSKRGKDDMEVDSEDDWVQRDDIDLVAKAVEDFRGQRISMVQNLRQFVLCYESILQWLHDQDR